MKSPERIDLDVKQVDALLQRTKELLPPDDYELIKAMTANPRLIIPEPKKSMSPMAPSNPEITAPPV